MKKFVCTVCGYIHEADSIEGVVCPVCKVGADKFEEMAGELKWADEHRIGVAQGVDEEVVEGLRANFVGECTEVGMYLAMSRQADREGYPEVAEAYKRIAFEEAEHAAKFAELLDNIISKKNLREFGMKEFEICSFTENIINNQKRLLSQSYIQLSKEEIEHIYRSLY